MQVPLDRVLHPEQGYVTAACRALGIGISAWRHPQATSTCVEKADLLGWPQHRIVKALYLADASCFVGIVLPELGYRLDAVSLLTQTCSLSRKRARAFRMNRCPEGMESGTCTPFPLLRTMDMVERLIVHRAPALENTVVDISLGGSGPMAHHVSCHLRYGDLCAIVRHTFGERVLEIDLDPYLLSSSEAGLQRVELA
ncbi:hypothetical protein [Variovorax boronicumulans]|uniref:hypothetical protein n=1 Tax=Variovorax boronicumulans TaxID=436515 RepID=UPI00339660F6